METQINYIIVGHRSREPQILNLASMLDAHMVIDDESKGANWNHKRAIQLALTLPGQPVFIEDDAVPVAMFKDKVEHWINKYPQSLISFYLGTGRPKQYQPMIKDQMENSVTDFVAFKRLIHGVCYTIPKSGLEGILSRWVDNKAADYAIGDAWNQVVIYPKKSLVDHMDLPSVEKHIDREARTEVRKAWLLDV